MKISEVIKKLQEIQKEHGDLFVHVVTEYYDVSFEDMDLKVCDNTLYIE